MALWFALEMENILKISRYDLIDGVVVMLCFIAGQETDKNNNVKKGV